MESGADVNGLKHLLQRQTLAGCLGPRTSLHNQLETCWNLKPLGKLKQVRVNHHRSELKLPESSRGTWRHEGSPGFNVETRGLFVSYS